MQKLISQFDLDWDEKKNGSAPKVDISDEKATLLYILDAYNKNLFEIDKQPIRKVREVLDDFVKSLVMPKAQDEEKLLFRIRQFFSTYRIDEYTYIQKTFEDFKGIIWDFADQLGEDARMEELKEKEIKKSLGELREAVEANSIDELRSRSREFIDLYIELQTFRETSRTQRMDQIQNSLQVTQKQLVEANQNLMIDHLTGANNRRSFDGQISKQIKMFEFSKSPVSILSLDIDFFKKINDAYGHDIGDFVLIECVKILKEVFNRKEDFIARVGGEEFCVVLPDMGQYGATRKAEELMQRVRKEVFVHGNFDIRFTLSMGIAQLKEGETSEQWIKRGDEALYYSKKTGRNRCTISGEEKKSSSVA